jgi:nucleotide-binding universal stress UspA family protein
MFVLDQALRVYEQIVVPVDGSEKANAALDHAASLAAEHGSQLHLLYVADTDQDSVAAFGDAVVDTLEREGERILSEAADRVDETIDVETVLETDDPAERIVEYAYGRDADLIVMGVHGRRDQRRYIIGSTTERAIRESTIPVLVFREG